MAKSGQPEKTDRTGQPEQDSQNRTARIGRPEQTTITGQPDQDSYFRTSRTGQPEQENQNRTGSKRHVKQGGQDRTVRTGQL
jgi:hypothetical protein